MSPLLPRRLGHTQCRRGRGDHDRKRSNPDYSQRDLHALNAESEGQRPNEYTAEKLPTPMSARKSIRPDNQFKYKDSQYTPYRRIMGRISLAKKYYEETETTNEKGTWLMLYDFKNMKPNSKFWLNLKRIQTLTGKGSLIQYSVFTTDSKRGAITAVKLAKHYGAQVKLFKVEEVNIE